MRLIDTDKLNDAFLSSLNTGYETFSIDMIREAIEEQSTAYAVDKVVEQIKDIGTAYSNSVGCDNACSNCDHGTIMRAIIKVVRKGGIEK